MTDETTLKSRRDERSGDMSRTRNERKRDRTYIFALTVIVAAIVTIVLSVAYLLGQHDAVVEPTQQSEVVAKVIPTEIIVHNDSEPKEEQELEESLVQQEARMPEFGYDYEYVMRVVAAESRGEPYEGQLAVAQCIRETSERTTMTPEEVVKRVNPNGTRQYAQPVDISVVTDSVRDACCAVFVHGISATDEPIRYFYSTASGFYSAWHENSLEYVTTIGNHRFFKEK